MSKAEQEPGHHADYLRLLNKYVALRKRERRLLDAIEEMQTIIKLAGPANQQHAMETLLRITERALEGNDE
jgi:hypothetical protein